MSKHEYKVVAHNYAHESENKIHDDETAAQYGFKGGLVPGVADYGYLSRAVFKAWGKPWMSGGSMNAKFIKPIYHAEVATAVAEVDASDPDNRLSLSLLNPEGVCCAVGSAILRANQAAPDIADYPAHPALAADERPQPSIEAFTPGRVLGSVEYVHETQPAREMSESLFVEALEDEGGYTIWHPALCLSYANRITKENVRLNAWVHTASHVNYFDQPKQGEAVSLRGRVADTYDKRGHVVTELDLAMFANEQRPLVQIQHTAIIRLAV